MPENKHRNPFEDHINSESFDVSHLGSVQELSELAVEMESFFETLPDILDHTLWDTELDARQKEVSAYLTTILAKRILRQEHGDLLEDLQDSELIHLLTVPVTLAMIAEQRLHVVEKEPEPVPAPPQTINTYRDDFSELPTNWGEVLNDMFLKAKDFIISLFRRG